MSLFLGFLGISFIVIATPGPDTAITIRNTILGGRAGGILTALGISIGQMVWAIATSLGIVAVLVASEPLFLAIKYAGAAYLFYLGVVSLRAAFRPSMDVAHGADHSKISLTGVAALRQGLISDLGNPKMAVFFASLLPQFIPAGTPSFGALLALGMVFSLMTFIWLALYACLVASAGDLLRRPKVRRAIEGVTGTLLITLGVRIATEQH